ncbi:MAG: hypothetical protein OEW15_04055 [Nitrospirota bacterium]|nr:hypothetical protein [Nitrospirota bacterium]
MKRQVGKRDGRDILLIGDAYPAGGSGRVCVEECEGSIIITARSEQDAKDILRTIAVDAIYHFPQECVREAAEAFRSYVERRYSAIRVVDMWTIPPAGAGKELNHVLPLSLNEGFDCRTGKRIAWKEPGESKASPPGVPADVAGDGQIQSHRVTGDERAA